MTEAYVPTGIPGVDNILGQKGIPRGHTILMCGGPGGGKTTFAAQFLHKGVTEHDELGLYVTLDEEPEDIKRNMSGFGWDLDRLEREEKLAFTNVSPVRTASTERAGLVQLGMREFRLVKLLAAIKDGLRRY